jgi:hypothetical protein
LGRLTAHEFYRITEPVLGEHHGFEVMNVADGRRIAHRVDDGKREYFEVYPADDTRSVEELAADAFEKMLREKN